MIFEKLCTLTTQYFLHHSFSKAPNEMESNPLLLKPSRYDGLDSSGYSSRSFLSKPLMRSADKKVHVSYIYCKCDMLINSIFYLKSLVAEVRGSLLPHYLVWLLP